MASPVKLYHREMHRNVGYFATWLPGSAMALGDIGVLDGGRFRRVASLKELGIPHAKVRESTAGNMSYSASAKRNDGAFAGARTAVARAELSIQFTRRGGFVFEAAGVQHVAIEDRVALAENMLNAFTQKRWKPEWVVVEAMYTAASATIIVSEDNASHIVLKAKAKVPLGSLPLADPKLGLTVSSSDGKLIHIVAAGDVHPLYSCVKVRDPLLFGKPEVRPVRGAGSEGDVGALAKLSIDDLLDS